MLEITSPAFDQEDEIPTKHTCEGEDLSPALAWGLPPEGTQSLAPIVDEMMRGHVLAKATLKGTYQKKHR